MDIFSFLTLLGGLALFLYGMNIMGEGLEKLSGGKLETILEKLTSNKAKGFLLGLGVTAIIQSSSATTVMLVGFVNSGIMKLSQTISIIMGANVGTTVTAWILSLTGLKGDSFFIRIFKPESFTPILALIGVIMIMMPRREKNKDIGTILIGFAILMFGMETMSGSVSQIKDNASFQSLFTMFSNPVLGILSGTILTAIIQSSSASVGILQALSITGIIPYSTAIPIIMGQNIGTTITPMISAINGNANAKRVAVACLYIKVLGVIAVSVVFYAITSVFDFSTLLSSSVNALDIAIIHTLFNILSTVVFLPFSKFIEKLAYITFKDDEFDKDDFTKSFEILDSRFLSKPSFAIEKCRELCTDMAYIAKNNIELALSQINNYDEKTAKKIQTNESKIDVYEDKLGTYLVQISSKSLSSADSTEVSRLLHIIGDYERISDHAVNILDVSKEIFNKNIKFSVTATYEIQKISQAVLEILDIATHAFVAGDMQLAIKVEPLEEVVDCLRTELKNKHIDRLTAGKCTIELGFVFSDLLTNLERVSDHCSNIAVCLLETEHNSFGTHEYLNEVKNSGNADFNTLFNTFKEKYKVE